MSLKGDVNRKWTSTIKYRVNYDLIFKREELKNEPEKERRESREKPRESREDAKS